jgi:hypothetical protein
MITPSWPALSAPHDRRRRDVDAFAPPTREATAVPSMPMQVGLAASLSSEGNDIPKAWPQAPAGSLLYGQQRR